MWSRVGGHEKGQVSVTTASSRPRTGPGGLPHFSVVGVRVSSGQESLLEAAGQESQRPEALKAHRTAAQMSDVVSSESVLWNTEAASRAGAG